MKELPKNLIVKSNLYIRETNIKEIPKFVKIYGKIVR